MYLGQRYFKYATDEEVNIILNIVEYKPKVIDFVENVVHNFNDDEVKV